MAKDRTFDSNQESETPRVQAWNSESAASGAETPQSFEKLSIGRNFSDPNVHPFEQIEWETRSVAITGDNGEVIFENPPETITLSNPAGETRVTGHIALNLVGDVETGSFFTQDRQGQKGSYLSLGLGSDYQAKASLALDAPVGAGVRDASGFVADFQSGHVFSERVDLTVNGAWYEWDSLRFDGSTAFVEAGLRQDKVMGTIKFAHQDPDQVRATINDYTVGLHYFLKGHNLRTGIEYRWGDSRDSALVGIQFML